MTIGKARGKKKFRTGKRKIRVKWEGGCYGNCIHSL
jgi:hypothetical protein